MAILFADTPHRFTGLLTIGKVFFILALVMYIIALALIALRFLSYPRTLHCSLVHPTESLFIPTAILCCEFRCIFLSVLFC